MSPEMEKIFSANGKFSFRRYGFWFAGYSSTVQKWFYLEHISYMLISVQMRQSVT